MVLLSAMATIQFEESPLPSLNDHTVVIGVPADGLCMWSCLYLACCSPKELAATWKIDFRVGVLCGEQQVRAGLYIAISILTYIYLGSYQGRSIVSSN